MSVNPVDFRQIEAFVVLAEELHFGRAAARLHLTAGRVSQLIRLFERQVGEPLFARTSRKVELLAAGEALLTEMEPCYRELLHAIDNARARARGVSGTLRLGYIITIGLARAHMYVSAFEREYPGVSVSTHPLNGFGSELDQALREGVVDLFLLWFPGNPVDYADLEPELSFGPTLLISSRALAVSAEHPLAQRDSVDAEELADYEVIMPPPTFPSWFVDAWSPPTTPSGRPIRRRSVVAEWGVDAAVDAIVRTRLVHLATSLRVEGLARPGVVLIPVTGLPEAHLVPVHRAEADSALIRRFVDVAMRA
ncbi:LysR substrate-binding domain-containing protein [Nocardia sp. CDC159]|uniref:LysR substrate-binding domain-containing protein n=1 Tax=Nocardia pulmonis TaxID=2951408 RepID=A0A9X2E5X4_9NOCA|nr:MULTISPECIES: LysR substrate-binding domain-containing protein [Nocardia]MCM6774897.1 LysR substrate-binding domain-containing protein [Nocardia pulmonis]MCM6789828.1 LysR substrate-binding domain-containing protein [Nocardia sp. CDC159]